MWVNRQFISKKWKFSKFPMNLWVTCISTLFFNLKCSNFFKSEKSVLRETGHTKKKQTIHQNSLYELKFKVWQIRGADFKHDNSFVKSQLKNTQIKHFWLQIKAFILSWNFTVRRTRGHWFQTWKYYFQIPA